ncbi:CPBP family intramembrane metalloprotease [Bacillus subtilis]|uniref:CPBP family intramembrane glutamic endopeptidase n=1 Tax=Bacillus TaxID=1386 RepID=UPI001E4EE605|nr:CPBP family intramembrane glutamic endopeptidase [Bacillus subtilis]MED4518482.1 CPBP family intramembrane metalloprotease [Bacillus subtilis]
MFFKWVFPVLLEYIIYFILVFITLFLSKVIRAYCRGSLFKDIIRLASFFLPFFIVVYYYGKLDLSLERNTFWGFITAVGISILSLSLQYKSFIPYLDKEFYGLVPIFKKRQLVSLEMGLLLSPFFEELLYRYYIPNNNVIFDSFFSGILFSVAHYFNDYSKSDLQIRDYINLFILGCVWYLSFYITGSIIPSMIGHLIYNLPNMIITYYRYHFRIKDIGGVYR